MRAPKVILIILIMFCFSQAFAQVNLRDLDDVGGKTYTKAKALYSGEFFLNGENGKLQLKGTMKNGLPEGLFTAYYENGNKSYEMTFKDGVKNGPFKEYFESGNLKQEVNNIDGKDDGKAIMYYETGEKHVELNFDKGVQVGDYIEYDKQGKVTRKLEFVNGKANYGKQINDLFTEANELAHKYKSDEAIALYTKAIEINPTIAELYFNRGAAKGNKFDMDGAIADYNKAIELYPDYKEAYANRGSAKINKYTTKGIIQPTAEQTQSACEDFYKAKDLGVGAAVEDMIYVYCERNRVKKQADTAKTGAEPLMFFDGKKAKKEELTSIDPNDVLEVEVIKTASKTAPYGPEGKNGVVIMTSINAGIKSYQKVLSALSKDYANAVGIPDNFLYQINGISIAGKKTEIIYKLYHLKADDIKSVSFNKTNSTTTVNIVTK